MSRMLQLLRLLRMFQLHLTFTRKLPYILLIMMRVGDVMRIGDKSGDRSWEAIKVVQPGVSQV